jgi:hypothetical protein
LCTCMPRGPGAVSSTIEVGFSSSNCSCNKSLVLATPHYLSYIRIRCCQGYQHCIATCAFIGLSVLLPSSLFALSARNTYCSSWLLTQQEEIKKIKALLAPNVKPMLQRSQHSCELLLLTPWRLQLAIPANGQGLQLLMIVPRL